MKIDKEEQDVQLSMRPIFLLHTTNQRFLDGKTNWTATRMSSFATFLCCFLLGAFLTPLALNVSGSYHGPFETTLRGRPFLLAGLFACSFVLLACVFYAKYRSQTQITREGTLLRARVVSWDRTTVNETWGTKVVFELHTSDGQVVRGEQQGPNRPKKDELIEAVLVLYIDEHHLVVL